MVFAVIVSLIIGFTSGVLTRNWLLARAKQVGAKAEGEAAALKSEDIAQVKAEATKLVEKL